MSGQVPVPSTWAERAQHLRDRPDLPRSNFEFFRGKLARARQKPHDYGAPLDRCANIAAQIAVLGSEADARAMFAEMAGPATAILSSRSRSLDKLTVPRVAALATLNLAESAGWAMEGDFDVARTLEKLVAVDPLNESETRRIVLAKLAWNRTEGLEALLLVDDLDARPAADEHFEFNVHGLQVHLTRALRTEAGLDAVARAWAEFLALFPRLYASDVVDFSDLLMAARTVHTGIAGGPVGDTLGWLRQGVA